MKLGKPSSSLGQLRRTFGMLTDGVYKHLHDIWTYIGYGMDQTWYVTASIFPTKIDI